MCQVFQFGQVRELQVERVHNEPAINRDGNDDNPKHCHGDVVEENQIVDDGEEQEREESESGENSEAPQPRNNFRFVFLEMRKVVS